MLLRNDADEIAECLRSLKSECENIEHFITTACFYMQGGLPIQHGYDLSMEQLERITKVIETHYEKYNGHGSDYGRISNNQI